MKKSELKEEITKEIYDSSVKLLQLLNILISKLGDQKELSEDFIVEVSELSWNVGTAVAAGGYLLNDDNDVLDELDEVLGY